MLVGGVFLFIEESFIFSFVLFLIGSMLLFLGIRGRKRELQSVIDTIDIVDGIGIVIDAIAEIDL